MCGTDREVVEEEQQCETYGTIGGETSKQRAGETKNV